MLQRVERVVDVVHVVAQHARPAPVLLAHDPPRVLAHVWDALPAVELAPGRAGRVGEPRAPAAEVGAVDVVGDVAARAALATLCVIVGLVAIIVCSLVV